jgi:resuscitation-promoting factor RpfB
VRGKLLLSGLCGCLVAAPAAFAATTGDGAQPSDPAVALTQTAEAKLRSEAAHTLRTAVKTATRKQVAARRRAQASAQPVAIPAVLQSIAQCESSGNPSARSGPYGGLFQFDQQTWASVGGSGDPAAASPAEQEMRAAMLYQQRGTQAWPVCGAGK